MLQSFEQKVLKGLLDCGVNFLEIQNTQKEIRVGVGVSGGADSVSLLLALTEISRNYPVKLFVISVNHFMRPDEQTCADADFVMGLCKNLLDKKLIEKSYLKELEKGSVEKLSRTENSGPEAAARKLRYKAFEDFIKDNQLDVLCLGHNKNDQLETILMRMLQGGFVESKAGIPLRRDRFVRPLLNISRTEIEEYLQKKNQPYCTDATNNEKIFVRNRIRKDLVPLLNQDFPGWDTALLTGAQKDSLDGKTLKEIADQAFNDVCINVEEKKSVMQIDRFRFERLSENIQARVLLKAINEIFNTDVSLRMPYAFIQDVLDFINADRNQECKKEVCGILVHIKKDVLLLKNELNTNTELFFSAIIEEDCSLESPVGLLKIKSEGVCEDKKQHLVSINGCESFVSFDFPVLIRNVMPEDYIMAGDSTLKKVSHILTDWHINKQEWEKILVIQELSSSEQQLMCILGKYCGFKDWIVKV